jgi:hypothetical protein
MSPAGPSTGDYPIRPVPLAKVRFEGGLWAERAEVNGTLTIPFILKQNEEAGRLDHSAFAGKLKTGAYRGQRDTGARSIAPKPNRLKGWPCQA